MAGGHGHGGGGHDHGHGGGGGGGLGLSFDISVGGSPMGVVSLAGTLIGALIVLNLGWVTWQGIAELIGWSSITLPALILIGLFLKPQLVGKILATWFLLVIALGALWGSWAIFQHMGVEVKEPIFQPRTNNAAGALRMLGGLASGLVIHLLCCWTPAFVAAFGAWWLWWGKKPEGGHH